MNELTHWNYSNTQAVVDTSYLRTLANPEIADLKENEDIDSVLDCLDAPSHEPYSPECMNAWMMDMTPYRASHAVDTHTRMTLASQLGKEEMRYENTVSGYRGRSRIYSFIRGGPGDV